MSWRLPRSVYVSPLFFTWLFCEICLQWRAKGQSLRPTVEQNICSCFKLYSLCQIVSKVPGIFLYFDKRLWKHRMQRTLKVLEGKLYIEAHLGDCMNLPEPLKIHLQNSQGNYDLMLETYICLLYSGHLAKLIKLTGATVYWALNAYPGTVLRTLNRKLKPTVTMKVSPAVDMIALPVSEEGKMKHRDAK